MQSEVRLVAWFALSFLFLVSSQTLSCDDGACTDEEVEISDGVLSETEEADYDDLTKYVKSMRFSFPCETPNCETKAYCVPIEQCKVLYKKLNQTKYSDYINDSRCETENEDLSQFKVCCGRYNNYLKRNFAKNSSCRPMYRLPADCGFQNLPIRGRIVGGQDAALGEYPWMVRIVHKSAHNRKSFGCTGFLIHKKFVVTAGHCIKSNFTMIRGAPYAVLLGEHNVTSDIDCSTGGSKCAPKPQEKKILNTVVHENYNKDSTNHYNDIALIELKGYAEINNYVRPICLLEKEYQVMKYHISGWGKTETEESSTVKQKLDLNFFDQDECERKMKDMDLVIKTSIQICAGGDKMKDSCSGDSGGPLMLSKSANSNIRYYAAGLVSYGIGCGLPGWPGVYTYIPPYVEWIKNHLIRTERPFKKKDNAKKTSTN